jgi:putative transport protein
VALGFLFGAITVPIPGIGQIVAGLSGVLVVALILGNLRRTGGLNWTIPLSANLVLRNLGLTLFLAQVGMSSGPQFGTVAETGFGCRHWRARAALVLPIRFSAVVFRMPRRVTGIVAANGGNPAIFSYANKLTSSDRVDSARYFPA